MKKQSKFRKSILDNKNSIKKEKDTCRNHVVSSLITFVVIIYVFFMSAVATFTLFHPDMRSYLQQYIKKEITYIQISENRTLNPYI